MKPWTLLLGTLVAATGHAQEPTLFSGTWRETLAWDTEADDPGEDVADLRSRLDLDVKHPLGDGWRVRLAARLQHRMLAAGDDGLLPKLRLDWPAYGMRHDAAFELREAFVAADLGAWGDWTLGRDVADWGALELQSPLRLLNPVDFRLGFAGLLGESGESASLPDFMLRGVRSFAAGTLELVVQPFFQQHAFSPFATDTAMLRPGLGPPEQGAMLPLLRALDLRTDAALAHAAMAQLDAPPPSPAAASVAARWKTTRGRADLSADAIFAWERMPLLRFDPDVALLLGTTFAAGFDLTKQAQALGDPKVAAAFQRIQGTGKGPQDLVRATWQRRLVLGLEATVQVADGWTAKADLAHSPRLGDAIGRTVFTRSFQPVRTALSQAGVGVEHQRGDWLVVLVEAGYTFVHDAPPGEPLFLQAEHMVTAGGGLVLRLGEEQQWELQAGGLYGVTLHDYIVAPRAAWAFAEAWRLTLGALFAGGPAESPGGLFDRDDQLLIELRRAF